MLRVEEIETIWIFSIGRRGLLGDRVEFVGKNRQDRVPAYRPATWRRISGQTEHRGNLWKSSRWCKMSGDEQRVSAKKPRPR
jgi:hypothetical protein